MLAAWPLYLFSKNELAPVEDQSHISLFFEASPDASLAAVKRDSLKLVEAITVVSRDRVHVVAERGLGRIRRPGGQGLR